MLHPKIGWFPSSVHLLFQGCTFSSEPAVKLQGCNPGCVLFQRYPGRKEV